MIDHVTLRASDFERSKAFYQAALASLGYDLKMEFTHDGVRVAGFIAAGKTDWWLTDARPASQAAHVALRAADRGSVDAFHRAGLAAGGRDNGAPGPRPEYHEHYYGAFLLDPDGNNIEAVCHGVP